MAKIAFLAVNEEMVQQAKKIVKNMDLDVEMKVVTSENVETEARLSIENGANVIIARGNHASIISRSVNVHLVEIVLTGQEIAKLIHEAREILHRPSPVIGIIGFKNMFSDIKPFDEILDVVIKEYLVDYSWELEDAVKRAAEDKVDLVIGGEIANTYAQSHGIHTLFLRSGEDSIREAFRIAEKVAFAIDLEKKNTAEFKTILDYSFDAIIKLNKQGMVVVLNYLAEKILRKRSEEITGRNISEVIDLVDEDIIRSVLTEGKSLYSTLLQKGNLALVANIAPIVVENIIEGAILSFQEFKKIEELEAEIRKEVYSKGYIAKRTFKQILGESFAMAGLKALAKLYAKYDAPIMISGESGTGKKLFAECIHNESLRRNNPFVMVDCAAYPPELLEKKLYGFVEGNYLHSSSHLKKGFFDVAHTGTIYLDKITELSEHSQLSLLRAIQEGNIIRSGDDKALPVNVRIICSVNKNIINLLKEGKFNSDLYYTLNVLSLQIPPLRERKEDVETLLDSFVEEYNNVYRKYVLLTDTAKQVLLAYPWHGNVQQLKKFCEKTVILAAKKVLDEDFIISCLNSYTSSFVENTIDISDNAQKIIVFKDPEASRLLELLELHKGNRGKVAEELKISKATLWRKIKKYNIEGKYGF